MAAGEDGGRGREGGGCCLFVHRMEASSRSKAARWTQTTSCEKRKSSSGSDRRSKVFGWLVVGPREVQGFVL